MNYHGKVCRLLRYDSMPLRTEDRHEAADLIEDLVEENAYLRQRLKDALREFVIGGAVGAVIATILVAAFRTYA